MSSSGSSTIHPLSNPYPQTYYRAPSKRASSQPSRRTPQPPSKQRQQRATPPVRRSPPTTPRYAPSTSSSGSTRRPSSVTTSVPSIPDEKKRSPLTPAVLRSIFASSRTPLEERSISRVAFFRFVGFVLSCLGISVYAARSRGIRGTTGLGLSML
ncbi:hypothetical protein FRC07_005348 [Ceratobasidium sp. 392]|nr:hypothetical protein FRC07_005348 [Ceratobasidium sp. 392]